jgi:hypothetical protein
MDDLIHSIIAASNQAASCNGKIITSGGACSGRNTHDGGGQQRPHRVRRGGPLRRCGLCTSAEYNVNRQPDEKARRFKIFKQHPRLQQEGQRGLSTSSATWQPTRSIINVHASLMSDRPIIPVLWNLQETFLNIV